MPYKNKQTAFWNKINIGESSECWEWQRFLSPDGYGKCRYLNEQLAHRAAWRDTYGEIPKDKCILHTCDNRRCCNPNHLFLGTREENNSDRDIKGRQACGDRHGSQTKPETRPHGETHYRAKLTTEDVNTIRLRYAEGNVSQRVLAREYNVTHATIGLITRREMRKRG